MAETRLVSIPGQQAYAPAYKIQRLYLKGASVEVPHMAELSREPISPDVGVDLDTSAESAGPGLLECVLRVGLHAKLGTANVFVIEVEEAGVFDISALNKEEVMRFVRQVAPSILFPFARKDLASLAVAGGFQPVLLDHVDFDSLLQQVVSAHRRSHTTAAMRVDVLPPPPTRASALESVKAPAAKAPAKTPLPTQDVAKDTEPPEPARTEWESTIPQPDDAPTLGDLNAAPASPTFTGEQTAAASRRAPGQWAAIAALVSLVVVGTAFVYLKQRHDTPTASVPETAQGPQKNAVVGRVETVPPKPVETPAKPPAPEWSTEMKSAFSSSRERLSDQPAQWFTVKIGKQGAGEAMDAELLMRSTRPVFAMPVPQSDAADVFLGVYPTQEMAQAAAKDWDAAKGLQKSGAFAKAPAAEITKINKLQR
jgi:preprotein translocase subunit SecB